MTELQIVAFFVLPVVVIAFGLGIYFFEMRRIPVDDGEPDLFDQKPAGAGRVRGRTMASREGLSPPSQASKG